MPAPRLNGPFKYRSSVDTDIRRTFARVRREQKVAAAPKHAAAAAADAPPPTLVAIAMPGRKGVR